MTVTRGTTNRNDRGSSYDRQRRREWLVETYRADIDMLTYTLRDGYRGHYAPLSRVLQSHMEERLNGQSPVSYDWTHGVTSWQAHPACRCYRCGILLTVETVTVDRIVPGCKGGTYRRSNIRPACGPCNSETGGALASRRSA